MRAVAFDGTVAVVDAARPTPAPDEALILVRLAGICGTDLEIVEGYKGFRGIPGHEFVGEVVEAADPRWIGRRVCGEINVGCGRCSICAAGKPGHCAQRAVVGILGRQGAFAHYLTLPVANLHQVPDIVEDERAVFVEPLAAAYRVLEQVAVRPEHRVAILGDGRLGLLCARVLAASGARVALVGTHPDKLARVNRTDVETIMAGARLHSNEFDIVVEATGTPGGLADALELTRPLGTVVLKTTAALPATLDLSPAVVKEILVVGSRCGPFPRALSALAENQVDVRDLIDARFPLDRAAEAFEEARRPGVIKVLLDPWAR